MALTRWATAPCLYLNVNSACIMPGAMSALHFLQALYLITGATKLVELKLVDYDAPNIHVSCKWAWTLLGKAPGSLQSVRLLVCVEGLHSADRARRGARGWGDHSHNAVPAGGRDEFEARVVSQPPGLPGPYLSSQLKDCY